MTDPLIEVYDYLQKKKRDWCNPHGLKPNEIKSSCFIALATFEDPDVISDRFVESEESQFPHICVLGCVPEVLKL